MADKKKRTMAERVRDMNKALDEIKAKRLAKEAKRKKRRGQL